MKISHVPLGFEIPENIVEFVSERNGVSMEVSINSTDVINGYGQIFWVTVRVSMLNKRCNRCTFQTLWDPNPERPCFNRHTYEQETYDDVFMWRNMWFPNGEENDRNISAGAKTSLEDAFDFFLFDQKPYEKIHAKYFDARKEYAAKEDANAKMERCPNPICRCGILKGKWKFCPQCGTELDPEAPDD